MVTISSTDLDVVDGISPRKFYDRFVKTNTPVILQGMMDQWAAKEKWTFDFFRSLGSRSSVNVEEGNVFQGETEFRRQRFCDYLDQVLDETPGQQVAYLSVFRIFDSFPELHADVDFSLIDQHKLKSSTVAWIGPADTVTGYHIDWGDNILAQLQGRKHIHLAPPTATPNMYVSEKFEQGSTLSQVDFDNVDHDRFPNFSKVQHHEFVLNPGEMVFIPRGWWHHVRSLDKSISVSNITYDLKGVLFDAFPFRIKQYLHDAGLWRCECTCHVIRDGRWTRK